MIEFVCRKKTSEETGQGTKYEVWFQEVGRVRNDRRPGEVGLDSEWKRYEVTREQYVLLEIGVTYCLKPKA